MVGTLMSMSPIQPSLLHLEEFAEKLGTTVKVGENERHSLKEKVQFTEGIHKL